MIQFKEKFDSLLSIKSEPNNHEVHLFERGQKYIQKISKISGIEMIAIVNSLSMYATHPESDIDLFIVTKPGMIWFVRFFSTLILWKHGVWRKGNDIAENICISFFITTEAMDLGRISIENDIYLYYWIYYMKPIINKNNTFEKFLQANTWICIDENQKKENQKYIIPTVSDPEFEDIPGTYTVFETMQKIFYKKINQIIRFFLLRKTLKSYKRLGNPEGIIISDNMLKFHNADKRKEIRDTIIENKVFTGV